MQVGEDFIASEPLRWIHRTLADKEVYFVANPTPRALQARCAFRITGMTPEAWFPDTGRIAPLAMFHESDGYTRMPLDFEPSGSMFVVFKKGPIKPSERLFSITCDGKTLLGMDLTGAGITKPAQTQPATAEVRPAFDPISRELTQNGAYALKMADDRTLEINLTSLPEPLAITGPWEVTFPPGAGAPEKLVMDKLVSWSEHSDAGVKHFSGSATYRKTFAFTPSPPLPAHLAPRIHLDLGKVSVMAAVQLNGKDLGILWKPPYRVDITDAVKAGDNVLEVRVVNLPINRMIGDELLPEDSERNKNGTLKQWPQWWLDGKPSPSGRFTFTSWRLWKKDAPLQESGLLGPLTVRTVARVELK